MNRLAAIICPLVPVVLLLGCRSAPPANVAAVVNNHAITYSDLDKEYQAQFGPLPQRPPDDQVNIQKMEVLRSMVDGEIMFQRAEKLNLVAQDSDIEARLTELKSPYTQEEFQKQLTQRGMTIDDLRAKVRRELSVQKLFNKEITSQISVTDKDIADAYNANKAEFNLAEPRIHLAQILVTSSPGNVQNLKGSKAHNDEEARQKITMLANRLRQGEDFAMLARNYSEDSSSAPNGGDLGFVPESSLEQASPELRKMLAVMTPGQVTPPARSQDGYRIFRVMEKEPAGQRELSDPRVQQAIRETLRNRKDQLLKNAYYEVARNETKIVNNFAINITQTKGKPPQQ